MHCRDEKAEASNQNLSTCESVTVMALLIITTEGKSKLTFDTIHPVEFAVLQKYKTWPPRESLYVCILTISARRQWTEGSRRSCLD